MSESLLPNSTLSRYRIVSKLGAGGMGEVYLAQDTKLDRKVALKIEAIASRSASTSLTVSSAEYVNARAQVARTNR